MNQTAITTATNTPLDSLKDVYAEADNALSYAVSLLNGEHGDPNPDEAIEVLDAFHHFIAERIAEHLGVTVDERIVRLTGDGERAANIYDDGTLVQVHLSLDSGTVGTTVKPRYHSVDDIGHLIGSAVGSLEGLRSTWRKQAHLEQSEGPAIS